MNSSPVSHWANRRLCQLTPGRGSRRKNSVHPPHAETMAFWAPLLRQTQYVTNEQSRFLPECVVSASYWSVSYKRPCNSRSIATVLGRTLIGDRRSEIRRSGAVRRICAVRSSHVIAIIATNRSDIAILINAMSCVFTLKSCV